MDSVARPDIIFANKTTGEMYYENVGKNNAQGQAITREKLAQQDLESTTGVPVVFTPYN